MNAKKEQAISDINYREVHKKWKPYFDRDIKYQGEKVVVSPTPLLLSMVNDCDSNGRSILYLACRYGFSYLSSILLQRGSEVNKRNENESGSTPIIGLCFGLSQYQIDINYFFHTINTLIRYGADITLKSKSDPPDNGYIWISNYLKDNKRTLTVPQIKQFIKLMVHIYKHNVDFDYKNYRSNGLIGIFDTLLPIKDVHISLLDFFFCNNDEEKIKIMDQLIDACDDDKIQGSFWSLYLLIGGEALK